MSKSEASSSYPVSPSPSYPVFRGGDQRELEESQFPICDCGIRTFMAEVRRDTENFGRRFFRCRNYKRKPNCLFQWIDQDFTKRSMVVIRKLVARERHLESELAKKTGEQAKNSGEIAMNTMDGRVDDEKGDLNEVMAALKTISLMLYLLLVISIVGLARQYL